MKFFGAAACLCCLLSLPLASACSHREAPATAAERAPLSCGYSQLQLLDDSRKRPVWIDLWYPAAAGSREQAFSYELGAGSVAPKAPVQTGAHPLVLLSHGAGGSASNYAWLAEHLAREGYVVAGVNHYGESRTYGEGTLDRLAMFRSWERVSDVLFAATALSKHQEWAPHLDFTHVIGLGHSSGGHTMLSLAGAATDPGQMEAYCSAAADREPRDLGCDYARNVTPEDWQAVGVPPTAAPGSIEGLVALVLLEPALGPTFGEKTLAAIETPTLVVASKPGDFLPFEPHAGRIARGLPSADTLELSGGAGHFVYLTECSLPIYVQGLSLCQDAPGVDRARVHGELETAISAWLGSHG